MNERLALLLGWEIREINGHTVWFSPDGYPGLGFSTAPNTPPPPDYTSWTRMPELQAFVRGLPDEQQNVILDIALFRCWDIDIDTNELLYITPIILGDAILEVCDVE